jgi:hypothetical protein
VKKQKMRILAVFGWPLVPLNQLDPRTSLPILDHAIKIWDPEKYDRLLLSGGCFLPRHIQTQPWCEIAGAYCFVEGVSLHRVMYEARSFDTFDNLRCTLELLEASRIHDFELTICTYPTHGYRIALTALYAHNIRVRIEPVLLDLTLRERFMQWLYVLYHIFDVKGTGIIAHRVRQRRVDNAKRLP